MKLTILFHTETGNTRKAADMIAAGAVTVPDTEVRCISLTEMTP